MGRRRKKGWYEKVSVNKRRFSLDEDFMNFNTDDLLYGFMRGLSTAKPTQDNKWEEYLTVKKFKENRKVIQNICGVTAKTINNRLNKLIEAGLVEEGTVSVINEQEKEYEYDCYYFPYDYDGTYKIIEQEMVRYLVDTRNAQAIRVYLYLLNCSTMKSDYVFTIREIKLALGYSESTTSADTTIANILKSFSKEGVIRFEKEKFDCVSANGKATTTERMVLKFIATSVRQF